MTVMQVQGERPGVITPFRKAIAGPIVKICLLKQSSLFWFLSYCSAVAGSIFADDVKSPALRQRHKSDLSFYS